MKENKILGLLIICFTLFFSTLTVMLAVVSWNIEKNNSSHYKDWIYYIPYPVYLFLIIPCLIGIYLLFKDVVINKAEKK